MRKKGKKSANLLLLQTVLLFIAIVHSEILLNVKPDFASMTMQITSNSCICKKRCLVNNDCSVTYWIKRLDNSYDCFSTTDTTMNFESEPGAVMMCKKDCANYNTTYFTQRISGPTSSIAGYWGSVAPSSYCDSNTAVSGITVWNDHYDNKEMDPDDGCITDIKLTCSSKTGKSVNYMKFGHDPNGDAASVEIEYNCPTGFFLNGIQAFMPTSQQGSYDDDPGMIGLQISCNKPNFVNVTLVDSAMADLYTGGASWSNWQSCEEGYSICGFSIMLEPINWDNTHVNEIKIECCI